MNDKEINRLRELRLENQRLKKENEKLVKQQQAIIAETMYLRRRLQIEMEKAEGRNPTSDTTEI